MVDDRGKRRHLHTVSDEAADIARAADQRQRISVIDCTETPTPEAMLRLNAAAEAFVRELGGDPALVQYAIRPGDGGMLLVEIAVGIEGLNRVVRRG